VVALVIGASGLVGSALMRALPGAVGTFRTRPVAGLRYLDAADRPALFELLRQIRPGAVYFPAADPNVDWCELNPDAAHRANVLPALHTLEEATRINAHVVFFSSDYVFDGATGPYDETAATAPLSVYGRQKLEVEARVLAAHETVIRTTTVYGVEQPPGKNFVLRLAARLALGQTATIPSDQFSTPTLADELARGAVALVGRPGLWNVAGPDFLARDRFAVMVAEEYDLDPSLVQSVPSADLAQAARRPLHAGLRTEKLREAVGFEHVSTREGIRRVRRSG
jgi:dTDP-4-dehydrorhamnose reductase